MRPAGRRRRLGRWLLTAAAVTQVAATAPAGAAPAAVAGPEVIANDTGARYVRVLEQLDALRREGRVPAMAVAILTEGSPVAMRTFGTATPDTPLRWGSITKSFTGLLALTLVRDGAIELASPIRSILGGDYFSNPWADREPVRLVHLLALSAGLNDLSRAEWNDNTPVPLWTALTRYAPERVVRWPPGLQHSYTNAAAGLAAAVIERAAGEPFDASLHRRVFSPLGMSAATLAPVAGLPGGFRADGTTEIPYWHMTYPAFGALNASIREMTRFLAALLNQGRVPDAPGLPADLVRRFLMPNGTLGTAAGLEVGYGAGIYGWVRDGHVFLGHGGDADGYRSRYGVLPDHGRGYAVLINTDNPSLLGRLRRTLETALVADLPGHPPLPRVADDLTPYTGVWYPASTRFARAPDRPLRRAGIRVEGSALAFRLGERLTRLYPVGGGRFVREGDPAVTAVFVRDPQGSLYLQGELGNFVSLTAGPCPDFLGGCD